MGVSYILSSKNNLGASFDSDIHIECIYDNSVRDRTTFSSIMIAEVEEVTHQRLSWVKVPGTLKQATNIDWFWLDITALRGLKS